MHNTITPEEVALFCALIKSGVILLLMLRLARPTGARELADILGLEEHTTARYLRQLAKINLVARTGYRGSYMVLEGRQLIFGGGRTVEKLQFDGDLSPVERALKEAGISNPKRQALASLPGVTAESIRAWEANLKHEKGGRYTPGLLIHMLESGEPPPPVNQNGHHLHCECEGCQRIKYCEWNSLGGD